MAVLLANNATSKLASSLTADATTLSVTSGEGAKFPSPTGDQWFPLSLVKANGALEIVKCTARSGDVFTVTRAQEGTAAQAFSAGDRVELRLTAAVLADMQAAIMSGWGAQPIGVPIPVWDHLSGVTPPPTDQGYRYVKLSAADPYNSGVLSSEVVSGAAPSINATGVVSLPGSPLNGIAVRLINTERRFLRPGESGLREEFQNAAHSHTTSVTSDSHSHSFSATTSSAGAHKHKANPDIVTTVGGTGLQAGAQRYYNSNYIRDTSTDGAHTHSVSGTTGSDSHSHTVTVKNSGGDETRPRNVGATYYMRVL